MITRGKYYFSPGWCSSIITLILVPLFIVLGQWQLNRAHFKNQIKESLLGSKQSMIKEYAASDVLKTPILYSAYKIKGQFVNVGPLYLDNQIFNHQVGYDILNLFKINDSNEIVLINRGWVGNQNDRKHLPIVNTPSEIIELTGIFAPITHNLILKKESFKNTNLQNGVIVQYIDVSIINNLYNLTVVPFVFKLADNSHSILQYRDWLMGSTSYEKHLAYTCQWWVMSVACLLYYLIINLKPRI